MFYKDLLVQIKEVHLNRKTPLLVGGSMMYFKTFFSGGLSNLSIVSEEIKNKINIELFWNEIIFHFAGFILERRVDDHFINRLNCQQQILVSFAFISTLLLSGLEVKTQTQSFGDV